MGELGVGNNCIRHTMVRFGCFSPQSSTFFRTTHSMLVKRGGQQYTICKFLSQRTQALQLHCVSHAIMKIIKNLVVSSEPYFGFAPHQEKFRSSKLKFYFRMTKEVFDLIPPTHTDFNSHTHTMHAPTPTHKHRSHNTHTRKHIHLLLLFFFVSFCICQFFCSFFSQKI